MYRLKPNNNKKTPKKKLSTGVESFENGIDSPQKGGISNLDQKVKVVLTIPPNLSSVVPPSSIPKIAGVTVMLSVTPKL